MALLFFAPLWFILIITQHPIESTMANLINEEWIQIDAKLPSPNRQMAVGYNPFGDSLNSIYLIGGDYNSYSRYLFQMDNETFSFLGNDSQSPVRVYGSQNSVSLGGKIYFGYYSARSIDYSARKVINSFQMTPENVLSHSKRTLKKRAQKSAIP